MIDTTLSARLAPYIPHDLIRKLFRAQSGMLAPIESVRGAILVVDIAGFTPIVGSLSDAGPRGIDALQIFLTSYYTDMIEVVHEHGGVIYQFAGDSILCCFDVEPDERDAGAALRAASCALEIRQRLHRFDSVELLGQSFSVSSKMGVSFGNCHRILLGDRSLWTHPVLIGRPIEAAVAAEKLASGGEVIVNDKLWALLPPERTGSEHEGFFKLQSLPEFRKSPRRADSAVQKLDGPVLEACERLIHPDLFKKITTIHQDFIGDFREISCCFACFDSTNRAGITEFVKDLNQFYRFVQYESHHYGGTLIQTDFTDKGNVLFILFGAPTAQEHKELLAARFARKLLHEKDRFSFLRNLRCGIATGHAYCGNLGSPKRKGYSAIGDVVNLASRLMTHVKDTGLYFDSNTEKKLRPYFITTLVENARLKGVGKSVPVYEITSEIRHHRGLLVEEKSEIIGRKDELRVLRAVAQKSVEGAGQVCIVSGEAGIGKSRLAGKLISDAQGLGIEAHYGICYSYEMFTPFYPWKELLYQFFQILESDNKQTQIQKLNRGLEGLDEAGPEWIPVIGSVMGLSIAEDPFTHGLDARRKNQKVFSIIFQLLEKMSKANPILLVFEDLHWADEISIHLIEHIAARCQSMSLMVLATMRPGEQLMRIHVLPHVHRIELVHLNADDTREFLRVRLGLDPPNTALEDLVLAKVQGNPFFIESIVHGLRERGYLSLSSDGRVTLTKSLQEITIPDSIQDVVLSRIDHLNETEKAVLKVASVIGRIFTLEAVYILLRQTINHHELSEAISTLNGLGLTILELEEPLTIIFKHIVIRDVAYNTLLVSAREDLHRRVAGYLEEKSAETPLKAPGILAYHFLAGNDQAKGLRYTLLAAQRAKEQYANKDAIHHYTRAVEILSTATFLDPGELADKARRAKQELAQTLLQAGNYDEAIKLFEECLAYESSRIERADTHVGLGRVYQEKGESSKAIEQLETSLRLLGRRAPKSLLGLAPGILVHLFIHAVYTLLPWTVRPISERKASGYTKQLHTLFSLVRIYYFVDIAKLTWAAMVGLNMARRSRSDYFMSLGLSYYGVLLFGAGLLKSAEVHCAQSAEYGKRSRDAVAEGIGLSRVGSHATFQNDLDKALKFLGQAVGIFKQVGEMWEMQTNLMLQATTYFLKSEFETAEGIYVEMGALGRELNAFMHQAWSHAWAPFCRYLLGTADAATVRWELEQGLRISIEINDLANQCAALNHMANVAVREQDVEEAAKMAVRSFDSIWRYHVLVPFLQIGLVDAAEAALFALEQGASSVPRSKLERIVRLGGTKARVIGRLYPYLRGPALRIRARHARLVRGVKHAEPLFMSAIACLEQSPNRWETGVACLDAAEALSHRRNEFLDKAERILTPIGARVELRRLQRIAAAGDGERVPNDLNPTPSESIK